MGARIAYNNFTGGEVSPTLNAMGIYMHVRDEKPAGTAGGAYSTAATWQKRDLNTVLFNSIPGASLNVGYNSIILPAGRYKADITVPAYAVNMCRAALVGGSGTYLVYSPTNRADYTGNGYTQIRMRGVFLLPAKSEVEVKMWGQNLYANGLGAASSVPGVPEIYTEVEIWKIL